MASSVAALLQQAAQFHRQGRLADAERGYLAALAQQPKSFDAQHMLGVLKFQQGRFGEAAELAFGAVKANPGSSEALGLLGAALLSTGRLTEALSAFDRAVVAKPGNLDARFNRAVARSQAGQWPQALSDYDQVVAAEPRHAAAWFNRGNALAQLARYEDAVASYDRALALAPNQPDILVNRGNALTGLGRYEPALASFDRTLALKPDHLDALSNRAAALRALKRNEEALAAAERALAIRPDHLVALVARANALHAIGRKAEAQQAWERIVELAPNDIEVVNNRGIYLLDSGRIEEALANGERAVALAPDGATSYFTRANALQALSRDAEAITDYAKALALRPHYPDAHHNFGTALQALERHAEAIGHFAKAAEQRPDFADPQWSGSASHLCLGQFEQGWRLYETRWARHIRGTPPRDYAQPRWDGKPVSGTLLVWGEQGPGDQVLYASLVPKLRGLADKIVLEIDPRLVALFARSFPGMETIGYASKLYTGPIDAHDPIGSLPKHFLRSWDDFPNHQRGYLVPDAERVHALRARLTSDGRRVVGLTWISRNSRVGKQKSARLTDFEKLLRQPGYRFVDLQYGDTTAERDEIESRFGVKVEHLDDIDNMNDIDGLAALIAACDAVLTVSSTTAHIAGAVGAPTFVMVPFGRGRFWYWFPQRQASPWYPRTQVRQQGDGQPWREVIEALMPQVEEAAAQPWQPPQTAT